MESKGQRIRRIRVSRKLTQQQVATALGVSRVAVTKWEKDQTHDLKEDNLFGLAKILEVSPEEISTGVTSPASTPANSSHEVAAKCTLEAIIAALKVMPALELAQVKAVADHLYQPHAHAPPITPKAKRPKAA